MSDNITVMGRVSLRDLALVSRYLNAKGKAPKSQSALLREGFALLARSLPMDRIESTTEALEELSKLGLSVKREELEKKQEPSLKVTIDGD